VPKPPRRRRRRQRARDRGVHRGDVRDVCGVRGERWGWRCARARGRGARDGGARERGDVDVDVGGVDERGRAVGVSWGEIR